MRSEYHKLGEHNIYRVVQEPTGDCIADFAVLFCAPLGDEYMRSHRAFRQLADLLARRGVVSMRFDYAGTGDSSGDSTAFSLSEARNQIKSMLGELTRLASVNDVRVIGMRLGAILAYDALSTVTEATRLLAWAPVLSGKHYLKELRQNIPVDREEEYIIDGTWWINGFPHTGALQKEIRCIQPVKMDGQNFRQIFHLTNRECVPDLEVKSMSESDNAGYEYLNIDTQNGGRWVDQDEEGSYRFSGDVYTTIVNWIVDQANE